MLPTTNGSRPSNKLSAPTGSLSPPGQPQDIGTGDVSASASRHSLLREGLIILVSMILATAFIIWGPAGDFVGGRAFTITTTNEVTYIYYNWTLTLPLETPTLNMQAWNNRLIGSLVFTAAPSTDTHYTVNVETTAPSGMFKLTPWTMEQAQQSGFGIVVSDHLPNKYGIDYANIVVSIPSNRHYDELLWNTYPPTSSYASLPTRKWDVHFDNLTESKIYFDRVRILTDKGEISSTGVQAGDGYFQTVDGPITGEYTVPSDHLIFNMTTGESS